MPRLKRIGALKPFSLRLEITHLLLAGRMSLGLQLCQEAPGIRMVEYSFLKEPEFEIQVRYSGRCDSTTPGVVQLGLSSLTYTFLICLWFDLSLISLNHGVKS